MGDGVEMVAGEGTEATLAWLTHPTVMGHPPTPALVSAPESASSSRACTQLSSSSLPPSVSTPRDSRTSSYPTAAQCLATVPILPLLRVIRVVKHKELMGSSATCTQNGAQDSRSSLS